MLRKLTGYAAYMFGANAFTAALTFVVSAIGMVSRSKEAFGDYYFYMIVYSLGQGVFIYGTNACIQRYGANDEVNRQRFAKLALRGFAVLAALAVVIGAALGTTSNWNHALSVFAIPLCVVWWWARYIFRANIDAKREARLVVIVSLTNTIGRFCFVTMTDARDALIYGDFFSVACGGIAATLMLPRGIGSSFGQILRTEVPREFIHENLRFARSLWLSGIVFSLRQQLAQFWAKAGLGSAPLGSLLAQGTMWQFVTKPVEYLSQATLSGFVVAGEKRTELYRDVLKLSLVIFPAIAVGISIGVPLLFQIVDFVAKEFGSSAEPLAAKYAEVPLLLMISTLGFSASTVEMVTNPYCVAEGKPRFVLYAQIANIVVLAAALFPLARAYGIYGVVIASAIGDVANAATYIVLTWRRHSEVAGRALVWGAWALGSAAVALALGTAFREWHLGWSVAFPAVGIYLAGMWIGGILRKEDLRRAWVGARRRA